MGTTDEHPPFESRHRPRYCLAFIATPQQFFERAMGVWYCRRLETLGQGFGQG